MRSISIVAALATSVCAITLAAPAQSQPQQRQFNIPAGALKAALDAYGRQSNRPVIYRSEEVRHARSNGYKGSATPEEALREILAGTGFTFSATPGGAIAIKSGESKAGSAAATNESADIVVTGTHIRGSEPVSPVTVARREDVERRGLTDLGGFARSLVQNYSGGQNPGIAASGQGGSENVTSSSALNLRGLGPDATLTLFDGHRIAYDAISQGVDISAVPLAAVDRIEVLTDGSSALYGSDAVGGVANVILRRDYDGAIASARIGGATDGGDFEQQYNLVTGRRWQSGGFMALFDYRNSTPITAAQRSYMQTADASETLLNGQTQYSIVAAGHQDIGDRLAFEFDGNFSDRKNEVCINFTATDGCLVSGSDANVRTRSWTIAPALELKVGSTWKARLEGTAGASKARALTDTYYQGVYLDRSTGHFNNNIWSLELNAEGPLFQLPGGAARLAVGGGLRDTKLYVHNIDVAGDVTATYADFGVNRQTRYGFAEMSLPLISRDNGLSFIDRVTLTGAIRYEDVDRVGHVATPKLGLIVAPSQDIAFKFSWGKSFKAPTLYQAGQSRIGYSQNGSTDYFPASPVPGTVLYVAGGNPDLKPERATNWTITATLTPRFIEGLRFDASYFHIIYKDRVVSPIPSNYSVAFSPIYANYVTLNPTREQILAAISSLPVIYDNGGGDVRTVPVAAIITNYLQNAARQTIDGIDLAVNYDFDIGPQDRMNVNGAASYLKVDQQLTASQPVLPVTGQLFRPPHWRASSSATWEHGNFSLTGVFSYIGGLLDDRMEPNVETGSYKSFDLVAGLSKSEGAGILSNTSVRLSVLNIFNEKPPYIRTTSAIGYHYDSTNFSTIGRFVGLTISKGLK